MFGLALSVGARLHPVTIGKLAGPMTPGRTSGGDRNQSATFAPLVRVSRDREQGFQRIVSNDFRGS
jgi:hypothetical protein